MVLLIIKGVMWIAEKILEQAEGEIYDADKIRGQLMELELMLDMGEITEEAYMKTEEVLLERLRVIRQRQAAEIEE